MTRFLVSLIFFALSFLQGVTPVAAGPVADRLSRSETGEEVWADTLYGPDFQTQKVWHSIQKLKQDFLNRPSFDEAHMVLSCFVKGPAQVQVNKCEAWVQTIIDLLSEADFWSVWRGPVGPRYSDDARTHEGGRQDQREALELIFVKGGLETTTQPEDANPAADGGSETGGAEPFAFATPLAPIIEDPVVDPNPGGSWLPDNAELKLEAHGLSLAPTLVAPSLALSEPDRSDPDAASMDFWFSIHPTWSIDGPQTLAALTMDTGLVLAVHLTPQMDGVLVSTGSGVAHRVDFPFERGHAYHIAVRSGQTKTHVHIDGEVTPVVLDVGFGDRKNRIRPVADVTLGAMPLGNGTTVFGFAGKIGKFRYWSSFLSDAYIPRLQQLGDPDSLERFGTSLVVSTVSDDSGVRLIEKPVFKRPRAGWWRQVGMNQTKIHNDVAFFEDLAHPNFSPMHQAIRLPTEQLKTTAERAAFRQVQDLDTTEQHPQFSHHPLYKIELTEGIGERDLQPVDRTGAVLEPRQPFHIRNVSAVKPAIGQNGELALLRLLDCDAYERDKTNGQPLLTLGTESGRFPGDQADGRRVCANAQVRRDPEWFWLAQDETIRGFTYTHAPGGGLANIEVHTTRSTFGPLAPKTLTHLPNGARHKRSRVFLEDGMPLVGITVGVGDAGFIDALGFMRYPGAELSGLVLHAEGGETQRFNHLWPDTYFALADNAKITPYGQASIRVANERLIYVTGIDPQRRSGDFRTVPVAFEWIGEEPAVQPVDSYNNTFVSLSKAVNLQANYMGYDILQMDPLHLVRTGADAPVFKQPDGDSSDYYDANRIFVPRGLRYIPEFTGRAHRTVHDTTTYSEFKDALSKSVNAGFDSKAFPSFSLSNTMSEARETMSEDRKMKSLGVTRAAFYDLVLEKQEIELSDVFRARIAALAEDDDYAGFIESFGTHYPTAVVYGGMGVLDIEMTEATRSSLLQNGIDTKTEINLMIDPDTGTGLNLGSENQSESSRLFREITSTEDEDFYWIGGAHMGSTADSWGVGEDGAVPIHVTLRRIDELLAPLFFDDPDITVRVRNRLGQQIDLYMQEAGVGLTDVSAGRRQGFVEIRMDNVFCGIPPADGNLTSYMLYDPAREAVVARSDKMPFSASIYPMLHFEGYDSRNRQLRNFAADLSDGAEFHDLIRTSCNTRTNLVPKSPFLESTQFARFAMSVDEILNGGYVRLVDSRDSEHEVIHPRFHPDRKDQAIDAIEVGATLGLKYLWDEYVGEGSLTAEGFEADAEKPPPAPESDAEILDLQALFCDTPGASECTSLDGDAIRAAAGVWRHGVTTMIGQDANCLNYCLPHVIEYSVRFIQ